MNAMHESSKKFKPTYILIALNIIVYFYTSVIGGDFMQTNIEMILLYGQVNVFVLQYGWYWQLFTAMFVHVNIMHIVGNMLFLLIFGLRAEEMFSIREYLLIYFLGGLAGNLLSLLFGPLAPPSAGASGAIFGLFGAVIIFIRRVVGGSVTGAVLFAFLFFLITLSASTNIYAQFGGLLAGLAIGYSLARRRRAVFLHRIMG